MKRALFCLLSLVVILLASCTVDTYPPPAPLALSVDFTEATDDDQIAVAIDEKGWVYTARTECIGVTPCRVIYEALLVGVRQHYHAYIPDENHTYFDPDIAVTPSGTAVITWRSCPLNEPNSRQCTARFSRSSNLFAFSMPDSSYYTLSAPVVASRGENIYIVHEVPDTTLTGSAIRFCDVTTLTPACHWAGEHPNDGVKRTDPAAAVDSDGFLHIMWRQFNAVDQYIRRNSNVGARNANMAVSTHVDSGTFLPPAIAIESYVQGENEYIYYLVTSTAGASDSMWIYYCLANSCASSSGLRAVDLPAAKQWMIDGKPSLVADSDTALVAFEADTTDHNPSDIYWLNYTAGSTTSPTASRPFPTDLPNSDCDPVATLVDGFPAVGWHICGFPPSTDDVYFYSLPSGGLKIHETNFAGRGGLDMASNGVFVAGVWNEEQSDGRVATWLAYNANMSWLPVTIR